MASLHSLTWRGFTAITSLVPIWQASERAEFLSHLFISRGSHRVIGLSGAHANGRGVPGSLLSVNRRAGHCVL